VLGFDLFICALFQALALFWTDFVERRVCLAAVFDEMMAFLG
jgi:hypothetical protein